MALLDITGVAGASPSWTLTVLDSAGVSVGDYVTAPIVGLPVGDYGIYRVSDVPDAFTIDVEDDISPNAPYGEPSAGSGSAYSATTIYKLSQMPDGGPGWGEALRRDMKVLDGVITNYLKSEIATEENISLTVDYTNGSSPAAGTRVTTQAEADAISPVKYLQDVLLVLPPFLDHPIRVSLSAEDHYAKPGYGDQSPFFNYVLNMHPFSSTGKELYDFVGGKPFGPGIYFQGATSDIETGIAGTVASNVFTRSAGTWTPDTLKGKFVLVTSGAGSGNKYLIVGNDATTLTLRGIATDGAATVSTYQLDSRVLNSTDGVAYDGSGISDVYGQSPSNCYYWFEDIEFGETGAAMLGGWRSAVASFDYCVYIGGFDLAPFAEAHVVLNGDTSLFQYDSSAIYDYVFNIRGVKSVLSLNRCHVAGDTGSSPLVYLQAGPLVNFLRTQVEPDAGFSSECVLIVGDVWLGKSGYGLQVIGNGTCDGVVLRGDGTSVIGIANQSVFTIDDCATAMTIENHPAINGKIAIGSGNDVGWDISGGSQVVLDDPSGLAAAVTEISLDGQSVDYADLSNNGDKITGPNGSSIMRR